MARLSLLEIEECRPFVIAMMSQAYGWIPTHLPLWLGVMFPWLKSFQNPHIPNDRGQELVRLLPCDLSSRSFTVIIIPMQEFTDKRRTSELTKPDAIALGDKPIPSKLKSLLQSAVLKGPPSYVKMSRNQRLSINLFGRINGLDTNFTAMHPSQDLGLSLTRISVFELQMMAAFAIPRMRPHHVAGNILALTRQARRAKQGVRPPL